VVDPNDGRRYGAYGWRPDVPKTRELPVLYLLHGVPSDPQALIDGEGLATRVRDWVAGGGAPFVLAVPDGNGSHHRDTEWADAADGSDRVEDRLLREVIPAVEGSHRRDAAHRAIGGFSMGGYGSINLALPTTWASRSAAGPNERGRPVDFVARRSSYCVTIWWL
jgi:S-formylglutathione hydrolase FrmB